MKEKKSNLILSKKEPRKGLLLSLKRNAGRNNQGRITTRHKGAGVKKLYRIINFGQAKNGIKGKVLSTEYDPYRTSFINLVQYEDGSVCYVLAFNGVKNGDEIICDEKAEAKEGNRMKIKNIPVGTAVFNIELVPGSGGKIIRSAGSSAIVLAHEDKFTNLQMPSGEIRKVLQECYATVGIVSYPEWRYVNIGRAGNNRYRGVRPTVRGSAMNPCDHPHGGGEGRTSIGLKHPKTPWGKNAYGVRTRNKRRWTQRYVIKRRVGKR
jgi:large subunit ribosomal protein L2